VARLSDVLLRFWPQPRILGHHPGLAARPPFRYTLERARG
jgi:hypothetical protein